MLDVEYQRFVSGTYGGLSRATLDQNGRQLQRLEEM